MRGSPGRWRDAVFPGRSMRPRHPSLRARLSWPSCTSQQRSSGTDRRFAPWCLGRGWVPPPGVLVPCAVAVATQSHRGELNTSQRRTPPAHRLGANRLSALDLGDPREFHKGNSSQVLGFSTEVRPATRPRLHHFCARATLRLHHHASRRTASHRIAAHRIAFRVPPSPPSLPLPDRPWRLPQSSLPTAPHTTNPVRATPSTSARVSQKCISESAVARAKYCAAPQLLLACCLGPWTAGARPRGCRPSTSCPHMATPRTRRPRARPATTAPPCAC